MTAPVKVMVVDDNPANLKLASDLLAFEGFVVQQATDATSCLGLLETVLPDIILMDIGLPGMDGLELTRYLKSQDRTKAIKIIALTAFAMKSDKDRVTAAGCDGYITKPIDTRQFATLLRQYL